MIMNLLRRILLFLIEKIGIMTTIAYYLDNDDNFLKVETYKNKAIPRIGEKVSLYINEENASFRVIDVEHPTGSRPYKIILTKIK